MRSVGKIPFQICPCGVRLAGSELLTVAQVRPRIAVAASFCRGFAGRTSRGSTSPQLGGVGASGSERQPASTATGQGTSGHAAGQDAAEVALFALPLLQRPAFPGFHQVVKVRDAGLLHFIDTLRKSGEHRLGGFMTKEVSREVAAAEAGAKATGGSVMQSLRRDAGPVSDVATELEEVGVELQVMDLKRYPNVSGGHVVLMPRWRIRRTRVISEPSPIVPLAAVAAEKLPEPNVETSDTIQNLQMEIVAAMKECVATSSTYEKQFMEVSKLYKEKKNPLKLMDFVASLSLGRRQDIQAVLDEQGLISRLRKVLALVVGDVAMAKMQLRSQGSEEPKLKQVVSDKERRTLLLEQMHRIEKELGIASGEQEKAITSFRNAIKDKTIPEEPLKVIETELAKLGSLQASSSEYNVCHTYLEWLTCMPWGIQSADNKDIVKAERILDEDHHGLDDVKERIMEHIAVGFLKESVQGKIMCLAGPPGVGKTSIGKSIARALDREFFRFSVGGLHDVAEIRGHRRTYVGAMPGKLIQCLKATKTSNPVILIDEIDKLGRDMRGDPSSALLEVLDPEQNGTFRDHYLDVPVDLSQVLFVCTANEVGNIPGPLLDRMEVMRIAGYVHEEKVAIAQRYLIPKTKDSCGVADDNLDLQGDALDKIISQYAREAGVRQLGKLLEKVSRKVALAKVRRTAKAEGGGAEGDDVAEQGTVVNSANVADYIGQPHYTSDRLFALGTPPGVVMGLAWTSVGGASLHIEARGELRRGAKAATSRSGKTTTTSAAAGGAGGGGGGGEDMKVTGQLGSVMAESSDISLTFARLFLGEVAPQNTFLDEARVHLHVPDGATPKDGPSAGVTITAALVSLALDAPVRPDLAMTGELTLTGKVLKVGGIKEKVIAAKREHVTTLVLPRGNLEEYLELKDYLRAGLTAHFVDHYDDLYGLLFAEGAFPPLLRSSRGQFPVVTIGEVAAEPVRLTANATGRLTTEQPPVPAALTGVAVVER